MRYDETTGNFIDDGPSMPSNPYYQEEYQYGQQPYPSPGETGQHSNPLPIGILIVAFVLGIVCERIGIPEKLIGMLPHFGNTRKESVMEASPGNDGGTARGSSRLIITCYKCHSQLDASELQHLQSFDCVCPHCNTDLHVEQGF